jgi:hypothetical protein
MIELLERYIIRSAPSTTPSILSDSNSPRLIDIGVMKQAVAYPSACMPLEDSIYVARMWWALCPVSASKRWWEFPNFRRDPAEEQKKPSFR